MPELMPTKYTRDEAPVEDEINLLDLAVTLAKHKKLILGAPLVVAVVTAVLTSFSPDIYTADTLILPPQQ